MDGLSSSALHCQAVFPRGAAEEDAIKNIREAITAWMWAEDQKATKSISPALAQIVIAV